MGKRMRAVKYAWDAYHYQRDKPHGKKAEFYHAVMMALQGAHLVWAPSPRWYWLNPTHWLLVIGRRRLTKRGIR